MSKEQIQEEHPRGKLRQTYTHADRQFWKHHSFLGSVIFWEKLLFYDRIKTVLYQLLMTDSAIESDFL